MTVPCSTCGAPCELLTHPFFEGAMLDGRPHNPVREWRLVRALYFLGDRNFCSPACVRHNT